MPSGHTQKTPMMLAEQKGGLSGWIMPVDIFSLTSWPNDGSSAVNDLQNMPCSCQARKKRMKSFCVSLKEKVASLRQEGMAFT